MKKGNIMWSYLVKAFLILFVLVILFFVISKGFNYFFTNTQSCESKGGYCVEGVFDCDGRPSSANCENKEAPICCVPNYT